MTGNPQINFIKRLQQQRKIKIKITTNCYIMMSCTRNSFTPYRVHFAICMFRSCEFKPSLWRSVLDTTLFDKVCQ